MISLLRCRAADDFQRWKFAAPPAGFPTLEVAELLDRALVIPPEIKRSQK
jgi:hypothetical protein